MDGYLVIGSYKMRDIPLRLFARKEAALRYAAKFDPDSGDARACANVVDGVISRELWLSVIVVRIWKGKPSTCWVVKDRDGVKRET